MRRICLAQRLPLTPPAITPAPGNTSPPAPRCPSAGSTGRSAAFTTADAGIMVATDSLEAELHKRGFTQHPAVGPRRRHVSSSPAQQNPRDRRAPGLIFLYVGRVSVGEEPRRLPRLPPAGHQGRRRRRAGARRARAQAPRGALPRSKTGEALAEIYASADVFVSPSLTDTSAIVLLEALASGLADSAGLVR